MHFLLLSDGKKIAKLLKCSGDGSNLFETTTQPEQFAIKFSRRQ